MFSCALSEAGSGSDAAAMKSRAVCDGDTWVLNGTKAWITNAGVSEFYIVMAVTDPGRGAHGISASLVEKSDQGVSFCALEKKLGIKGAPILQPCPCHAGGVLGVIAAATLMGSDWYDIPMEAVVDQAGRIVLPKFIRDALGLLPGTKVDISPYGAGVQVVPAGRTARLVEEDGVLVSAGDTPVDDDILFSLIDAGRK